MKRTIAVLAASASLFASTFSGNTPTVFAQPSPDGPVFDPNNFVDKIDNPYFPLEPGTIFRLRGTTDEGIEKEKIEVTNRTKEILGVTTTIVEDTVRVDGKLHEFTYDWYAQDGDGNVWYFGEDTETYKANGNVESKHGSWEAGVDGAEAGIIMSADPQVTDSYRQELYKGEAEDMFWVVQTGLTKRVPSGRYTDVIQILEWTRLEPKVVVEKFLAPGIGLIAEHTLSGGKENVDLISIQRP